MLNHAYDGLLDMAEALGYTITRKPIACEECNGTGEVEVTLDEPDGDYLYEQARDRRMEE